MTARWRRGAALTALAVLAACGNGYEAGPVATLAASVVPGLGQVTGQTASPAEAPGFAPADIAADPDGFIIMGINALGQPALARRIESNARGETWLSQNGYTAAFRDGMLVATRGTGDDLMAADPAAARAALRQGGGSYRRVHETMDDLDRIVPMQFDCTLEAQGTETVNLGIREVEGRKFAETCTSRTIQFENLYWLDASGEILSSRQFIARTVAYLRSNRI